jgi:toxin ParE1/3/4
MDLAGTQNYKLSEDARLDLARIYWRGYEEYGEAQADRYYQAFFQRFDDIANSPYQYPSVDHIRNGYRRSVCGADSIYYRLNGNLVEIMRILGQQDVNETL